MKNNLKTIKHNIYNYIITNIISNIQSIITKNNTLYPIMNVLVKSIENIINIDIKISKNFNNLPKQVKDQFIKELI